MLDSLYLHPYATLTARMLISVTTDQVCICN